MLKKISSFARIAAMIIMSALVIVCFVTACIGFYFQIVGGHHG